MRDEKGRFIVGAHASVATQFKKGNVPFNKGMRQQLWLSQEAIKNSSTTRFKKGNVPPQIKPMGYVSCVAHRRKGQVVGYDWYINIDWEGNRCEHYNYRKYLWETFYGEKAPKGMIFVAKNGNQEEKPTIENIEMISRAENMKRNGKPRGASIM